MSTTVIPYSAACERNQDPLQEVLGDYFSNISSLLEIGSGTGQHAVHFARQFPQLTWQTSDRSEYLGGIQAQLKNASIANALSPIILDVNQKSWTDGQQYEALYTANTLHIMTEADVHAFFAGLPLVSKPNALLFIYGPFKYQGLFTSESNEAFDLSLRSRQQGSAIRDFELIQLLAHQAGFSLLQDCAMPANNQCLVWQFKG